MIWWFVLRIALAGAIAFAMALLASRKDIRTFTLIAMGSALVSITSTEFFRVLDYPWTADPGRLSGAVIAALGFLGTGLIWTSSKGQIQGLSNAASLWVVSIIGLLVGAGLQNVSVLAAFVVLILYWLSEKFLEMKSKD